MKKIICALAVLLLMCGCAEKPVSLDLTAEYVINAVLEPEEKRLTYTQEVTITNGSDEDVDELYFHLYGNFYATEDERISVLSLTDGDGGKLRYKLSDGDQLCRVKLGSPLPAGGETKLCFSCEVTIPVMADKYGVGRDGEIQMPFFYPQLAVCDENGWDKDSLNSVVDGRYAEMADYTLVIAAPEEYVLAANGAELSCVTENGMTTYSFEAERRRDLVFIACKNFERMERTVGNTRVLGCFNSERMEQADMEAVMNDAAAALEFFNETYVEYPYETLVVTNDAWATKATVSMEYSGLVTIARWHDNTTTYHELAHQWFYFLIGDDENAEPWLDESFAEYSAILCAEVMGVGESSAMMEVYETMSEGVSGFSLDSAFDVPGDYAAHLFYQRGGSFLRELEAAMGRESFLELLSGYCNEFLFENVTTEDFLGYLREHSAVDVEEIIGRYFWK